MLTSSLQGGNYPSNLKVFRTISTRLNGTEKVLNVGCGSHFEFERNLLEDTTNAYKITSIDLFDESKFGNIPTNQITYKKIDLETSSLKEKLKHENYDVICLLEVIEHLNYPDKILKDIIEITNPTTRVFISFPNLSSLLCRINLFLGYQPHILEASQEWPKSGMGLMGRLNYSNNEPLNHVRAFTRRAMLQILKNYGFTIDKEFGFSFIPFWPKHSHSLAQQILFELRYK